MRTVLLTDERGNPMGTAEISLAHSGQGLLHKAFSIFVFRNNRSEILLQKRSAGKRFGSLWTNTCCSHLKEGDDIVAAGERRLSEELGFSTTLTAVAPFVYWAQDSQGNVEHEYDTVLVGDVHQIDILADPAEVSAWKWFDVPGLQADLKVHPEKYTPWFSNGLSIALSAQR